MTHLPSPGRVEKRGAMAIVSPYPRMTIDDLLVLKRATQTYAHALRAFGVTDYQTWAHLIVVAYSRPFSATHQHTAGERHAAEAMAAELIAVQKKYEEPRHVR